MIRPLRKRHRLMFFVLAVILLIVMLLSLEEKPDWTEPPGFEQSEQMSTRQFTPKQS